MVVALDEAGRLYSSKTESTNEGPSYIATMTSVIRKMHIALFVWTQSCKDISNSIIANSGIKVMCRVGSATDHDIFGRAMGLTSQQAQWCKTNLDIGTQVIKMGFGWMQPFLNRTPNIRIPENVTDMEVQNSIRPLMETMPGTFESRLLAAGSVQYSSNSKTGDSDLTKDEKLLLNQIRSHSQIPSVTKHYKMAGLSTKKGTLANHRLLAKGLIKQTTLESGRRGAAKTFLEVVTNTGGGRLGGSLHNYLRKKALDWYCLQNCKVEVEKSILVNGQPKFVDLAVIWPDGKSEAVEVETESTARAIQNIQKNLSFGFNAISVLTPNRKVRDTIKNQCFKEIETKDKGRIRFPPMSFYDM
jgi:hypothetical protein